VGQGGDTGMLAFVVSRRCRIGIWCNLKCGWLLNNHVSKHLFDLMHFVSKSSNLILESCG
jgi:hypothetical protein